MKVQRADEANPLFFLAKDIARGAHQIEKIRDEFQAVHAHSGTVAAERFVGRIPRFGIAFA